MVTESHSAAFVAFWVEIHVCFQMRYRTSTAMYGLRGTPADARCYLRGWAFGYVHVYIAAICEKEFLELIFTTFLPGSLIGRENHLLRPP